MLIVLFKIAVNKKLGCRILIDFLRPPNCIKGVRIQSYSGSHSPAFGLNVEGYRVSLRIQSGNWKIPTRITLNTNTFHAVSFSILKG